jgi:HlyD family secretion protein
MAHRFKKKWFLGIAAVAIVALVLIIRGVGPVPATSYVVKAQDALETVLATGRVVGEKTIPLSFPRPGRLADVLVENGDRVKAGQVLMVQDNRHEQAALAQSRTALDVAKLNLEKLRTVDVRDIQEKLNQAQANADYATNYFQRQSELFKQGTITGLQYEQAKKDKTLADSTLEAARNQLKSIQDNQVALGTLQVEQAATDLRKAELSYQDTFLRSPFDGQVVEHLADKGEFVLSGQKVITFIPFNPRTYAEIQVDETNIGQLKVGQRSLVTSSAFPERSFPASVERVAPIVDPQRGTFTVRLVLDEHQPELLPESAASVQIVLGEAKNVLVLEQNYLVRKGAEAQVFVLEAGKARLRSVTVRELGNGLFACESGLRPGDMVLLPGNLKDGDRVKPARSKNP